MAELASSLKVPSEEVPAGSNLVERPQTPEKASNVSDGQRPGMRRQSPPPGLSGSVTSVWWRSECPAG